ncbi:GNAT family N-acetyltransferase [Sanguibacter sp. 25GB23B1]|uniref:GNAT family N-acetyltransferase n=1 Tax=unclassified Sanguibacter TaxID=2645534 RepID=UPI0032AEA197
MTEWIIRPFVPSDRERLNALFVRAGAGSPSSELWGHAESERAVYLDPYVELEPDSLFLAEVDGELVGYLTGCRDSSRLPGEDERITRVIKQYRLMTRPRTIGFFLRATADMVWAKVRQEETVSGEFSDPRWPAHLHINVAPEARGSGVAGALMQRWIDRLTDSGSPGCYLQTLVENTRAVRYFERMGFSAHGSTPLVPGIRHQHRRLHQLTMVRPPAELEAAGPAAEVR